MLLTAYFKMCRFFANDMPLLSQRLVTLSAKSSFRPCSSGEYYLTFCPISMSSQITSAFNKIQTSLTAHS